MRVQKPAQVASTKNAARVAAVNPIRVVAIPESELWLYSGYFCPKRLNCKKSSLKYSVMTI